ncbi:PepSY domain-containing protein [Marinimicrobium sp. LS-A18]|uniref:PepSY domain-containing protein n=1 Tax=Marinimicrobium sp. LS-A18 TaxID=1381596 RepID=UPI001268C723|nr:PepSY domain-containing protein [Marinimicrobium sp. LS-A18]
MTQHWGTLMGRGLLIALLMLAGAPLSQTVSAAPQSAQILPIAQAESRVSASRAAAIVQKRYGGKVLKVDTQNRGGRVVHRIKILQDNGRISTVMVDGQSGQILKR